MLFRSFRVSVISREGAPKLTGPMILAGATVLTCAAIRLSGFDHAGFSFCYFKTLTGYACLTCGATRALGHLSRFDLLLAIAIQPLVTLGIVGLLCWGLLDAVLFLAGKRTVIRMEGRAAQEALAAVVALALINWAYLLANGV